MWEKDWKEWKWDWDLFFNEKLMKFEKQKKEKVVRKETFKLNFIYHILLTLKYLSKVLSVWTNNKLN